MRLQVYMEDAPSMIKKIFGEQARFLDFLIVRKLSSAKSKQLRGSLETHLGKRWQNTLIGWQHVADGW